MKSNLPLNQVLQRQAPRSICILRLSALGDVCNCLPAIRALQRQWPDCRITWIIGKVEKQLLLGLEGVELIAYDKKTGLKGIFELRRQLAGRKFDVLLHMQAALRASLVSLAVKADLRFGFDKERAKDYQYLFTNRKIAAHPKAHVLEGFMDFIEALGVSRPALTGDELTWNMPIPDESRTEALSVAPNRPFMLISPCSSQRARNFRNWSPEGYAGLMDYAYDRYGLHSVLSGGNTELERAYGRQIQGLCRSSPINLIGETSLKTLLALVEQAHLVVAPDSGPMHMATATGTPALGLYASSNPDRTGPYLSRQWVVNRYPDQVQKHLGAAVDKVSWGKRVRDPQVMLSITVEEVFNMLDQLINDNPVVS
ncbi:glycosyl transferase [Motiliproteus sp. MSK22-1]|nr:glycosyl transferase [Motiliproteus sp. MSK22-1]